MYLRTVGDPMLRPVLFIVVLAFVSGNPIASEAADPNQFPTYPQLGRYSNIFAGICGKGMVDTAPAKIPEIGCFSVKSGASLTSLIEGRSVRIDVDAGGTNNALMKGTGDGYAFCKAEETNDCQTAISVLQRKPGEFVVFDVRRQFAPGYFVTNEENWEYEKSKGVTRNK